MRKVIGHVLAFLLRRLESKTIDERQLLFDVRPEGGIGVCLDPGGIDGIIGDRLIEAFANLPVNPITGQDRSHCLTQRAAVGHSSRCRVYARVTGAAGVASRAAAVKPNCSAKLL